MSAIGTKQTSTAAAFRIGPWSNSTSRRIESKVWSIEQ